MADSPKEAEAAQALFCSIADYVGKNKIDNVLNLDSFNTYYLFKKSNQKVLDIAYKQLDVPGISIQQIEKFLTDKTDWYQSSIIIAKKVIKSLSTIDRDFEKLSKPKWQNIFYVRGAKADKSRSANTMENIEALWKIANKNDEKFGDVNKWSPADIYFVSENAERKVDQEIKTLDKKARKGSGKISDSYDFLNLNKLVNELVDSGDLLPLSLKKAVKKADLYKYNFDRKQDEKELASIEYYGISDWSKLYKIGKPVTRDIKIYFSKDKKAKLKVRHDPSNDRFGATKAVKAEIEISGSAARGGSTASMNIISQIISRVDKSFAREVRSAYDKGIKEYEVAIQQLNIKYGVKQGQNKSLLKNRGKDGQKLYEAYKQDRIDLSAIHLLNKLMPVIYSWFKANESDKTVKRLNDKVLQKFIEYTSSRSPQSGKFVIAK